MLLKSLLKYHKIGLCVQGESMYPLLHSGDKIFIKKINFQNLSTDDILLINKKNDYIIHRVIYKYPKYIITKGDNNLIADGKIYPRQIIGKVYKIKRDNQLFNLENFYLLQSTLYLQEILKVKHALEKEKVNFVFLKGLPLHLFLEKRHPNRIYCDCDILIAKKDLLISHKILSKLKYKKVDTYLTKTQRNLQKKDTQFSYAKKISGFDIIFDIHADISLSIVHMGKLDSIYPQIMLEQLTKKMLIEKRSVIILNEYFPILSLDNLCVYLAIHFFHHNYKGIFRLEVLDKVVRYGSIKDTHFMTKCSKSIVNYKLQNYLYPVFLLLKRYFKSPITKRFLIQITPQINKFTYINLINSKSSIFNDETRIEAGVNRFKNLYYLSFSPFIKKILVFLNPKVIYSILLVLSQKKRILFYSAMLRKRYYPTINWLINL